MNYNKLRVQIDRESLEKDIDLIFTQIKNLFISKLIMLNIEHVRNLNNYMGIIIPPEKDIKLICKIEDRVRSLTVPFPNVFIDPSDNNKLIFEVDIYKTLDTTCCYKFIIKEETQWLNQQNIYSYYRKL